MPSYLPGKRLVVFAFANDDVVIVLVIGVVDVDKRIVVADRYCSCVCHQEFRLSLSDSHVTDLSTVRHCCCCLRSYLIF